MRKSSSYHHSTAIFIYIYKILTLTQTFKSAATVAHSQRAASLSHWKLNNKTYNTPNYHLNNLKIICHTEVLFLALPFINVYSS